MCTLLHFLKKEEGDEEDEGIPWEVRRSGTGECKANGAWTNLQILLTCYKRLKMINTLGHVLA